MRKECKIVKLHRIGKALHQRGYVRLGRLISVVIRLIFSAEIPSSCSLGKDVQLKHGGLGIVLHDHLTVGERTIIYQNVTIGGRERRGTPIIGSDVYIGAGACIIGCVKIGNGAKIGANSVVLNDVSDNETVVGIPARVVKNKDVR